MLDANSYLICLSQSPQGNIRDRTKPEEAKRLPPVWTKKHLGSVMEQEGVWHERRDATWRSPQGIEIREVSTVFLQKETAMSDDAPSEDRSIGRMEPS